MPADNIVYAFQIFSALGLCTLAFILATTMWLNSIMNKCTTRQWIELSIATTMAIADIGIIIGNRVL